MKRSCGKCFPGCSPVLRLWIRRARLFCNCCYCKDTGIANDKDPATHRGTSREREQRSVAGLAGGASALFRDEACGEGCQQRASEPPPNPAGSGHQVKNSREKEILSKMPKPPGRSLPARGPTLRAPVRNAKRMRIHRNQLVTPPTIRMGRKQPSC